MVNEESVTTFPVFFLRLLRRPYETAQHRKILVAQKVSTLLNSMRPSLKKLPLPLVHQLFIMMVEFTFN
jgi:hypothetical protein